MGLPADSLGDASRENGPSKLVWVPSSTAVLSCRPLTRADRPRVSESRMHSCRAGVQILPTAVMNSIPLDPFRRGQVHLSGEGMQVLHRGCHHFPHPRVRCRRHLIKHRVCNRFRRQLPHAFLHFEPTVMPALPLAYRPPGTTASPDVVSSVLDNGIY